jgi:predicted RNase H-like HicB family nuclease
MAMKRITVIVEKGTDLYSAYIPDDIKSVFINGQGKTIAAAMEDMKSALDEAKESFVEDGKEIPLDLDGELRFQFKYDIASLFDYFDEINISSFARKNGINESLLRKYRNRLAFASERQRKKIEFGLHRLGRSLSEATL